MDVWNERIKLNQKIEGWIGDFIVLYYEEEESSDIKNKMLLKDRLLFRDFGVFVANRIEKEIQIEVLNELLKESKPPLDDKLKTIFEIKEEQLEILIKKKRGVEND